jgi:CRP/FNR family cyclic AMP-dependent transcriptional regulator
MSQTNGGDIPRTLTNITLLSSMSSHSMQDLVGRCRWVKYGAGKSIIEQGKEDTNVYFIITGTVHVLNYSDSGRAVTFATLQKGDIFGELAAIVGLPRSAWVCSVTPCLVATTRGPEFLKLVSCNPEISLALLRRMSSNIRHSDERLTDVTLLGAEQRVCMELIRMAKSDLEAPGGYVVSPMLTHANFANLVGVSRETVTRIFRRLREDTLILRNKRGLCILNRELLERRAFM